MKFSEFICRRSVVDSNHWHSRLEWTQWLISLYLPGRRTLRPV